MSSSIVKRSTHQCHFLSAAAAEPSVVWLSPDGGNDIPGHKPGSQINTRAQWIFSDESAAAGTATLQDVLLCADEQDGPTQRQQLLSWVMLQKKGSHRCRVITSIFAKQGQYLNLSWSLVFGVPYLCKLQAWVSMGDLSNCHVGIGFVFQWECYVTALELNAHNATKGWSAPVKVSAWLFWVAAQVSPKPRIHSRIKNSRRRFAVELGVVSCRWCTEFLCTSFSSKQYLASVSSELG